MVTLNRAHNKVFLPGAIQVCVIEGHPFNVTDQREVPILPLEQNASPSQTTLQHVVALL